MRYWWVNQNQTYRAEIDGGYIWSPKRKQNGDRNQFYEYMREVSPEDQIFSFRNRKVGAVGLAVSNCYEALQPGEFGTTGLLRWEKVGWRVDVDYTLFGWPVTPKDHIAQIRPFLPQRYAPLSSEGNGFQAVYLTEINKGFADLLTLLLKQAGNNWGIASVPARDSQADTVRTDADSHIESEIRQSTTITDTDKEQLVKSRRGQGRFRQNVQQFEDRCRVSGVSVVRFLIASHMKPWRSSSNDERLDGENGLLLSPNVDLLFDRGFISFEDDGRLLVSPVADAGVLGRFGVRVNEDVNVGTFTAGQQKYLAHHRREVFLKIEPPTNQR